MNDEEQPEDDESGADDLSEEESTEEEESDEESSNQEDSYGRDGQRDLIEDGLEEMFISVEREQRERGRQARERGRGRRGQGQGYGGHMPGHAHAQEQWQLWTTFANPFQVPAPDHAGSRPSGNKVGYGGERRGTDNSTGFAARGLSTRDGEDSSVSVAIIGAGSRGVWLEGEGAGLPGCLRSRSRAERRKRPSLTGRS